MTGPISPSAVRISQDVLVESVQKEWFMKTPSNRVPRSRQVMMTPETLDGSIARRRKSVNGELQL